MDEVAALEVLLGVDGLAADKEGEDEERATETSPSTGGVWAGTVILFGLLGSALYYAHKRGVVHVMAAAPPVRSGGGGGGATFPPATVQLPSLPMPVPTGRRAGYTSV